VTVIHEFAMQNTDFEHFLHNYCSHSPCHIIINILSQFNPELVLVSCGLDAAKDDPLVGDYIIITSWSGPIPMFPGAVPRVSGRLCSHDSSPERSGWREDGRCSRGEQQLALVWSRETFVSSFLAPTSCLLCCPQLPSFPSIVNSSFRLFPSK
jgi:hypothetical protein